MSELERETNRRQLTALVAVALAAAMAAWWLKPVHADGIPTAEVLHYSGYLEEGGAPVNGTREVRVTFLDADDAEACSTGTDDVSIVEGRFRIALPPACVDAVRRNRDLRVQVTVGTTTFPRERLSAVPYALEAESSEFARQAVGPLREELDDGIFPAGMIVPYAGDPATPPDGWLVCDGSEVSTDEHPDLFAAVGTRWGDGDGSGTTFNLPDLGGRFLRGVGGDATVNPDAAERTHPISGDTVGDVVGSLQGHAFGRHSHTFTIYPNAALNFGAGEPPPALPTGDVASRGTTANGGNETRPVNAAVVFLIRT